jgi:acylglycerol lipase
VIALHGFSDYSGAFKDLGRSLYDQGFIFYADDQRGFGDTIGKGIWPGRSLLAQDLKEIASRIKKHTLSYPCMHWEKVWERLLFSQAYSSKNNKSLNISPSDKLCMLESLRDDPRYINQTRLNSIYGLTNLMDKALEASSYQRQPLLVLYGARDHLVSGSSI